MRNSVFSRYVSSGAPDCHCYAEETTVKVVLVDEKDEDEELEAPYFVVIVHTDNIDEGHGEFQHLTDAINAAIVIAANEQQRHDRSARTRGAKFSLA